MDILRMQLDELMGRERNVPLSQRYRKKEHFNDPDVCKYFLVSFCPHDLFPNTKCDLGPCVKRHDDHFKKDFQTDPNRLDYEPEYIDSMIRLIEGLLAGVEAKIKKASSKVDPVVEVEKPKELMEKIEPLDNEIKNLLAAVEKLGDEGKIEESEKIMAQVELFKKKKEELILLGEVSAGLVGKSLKVCEICGALQSISDNDRKSQTHLEGKLHTGFALLRKELEILKARKEEIKHELKKKTSSKQEHEGGNESNRDRHHKKKRSRSREDEKDRHKSRDHRRRRDRSRSDPESRSSSSDDRRSRKKHSKKHSRRHRSRSSSNSSSRSSSERSRHNKRSRKHKSSDIKKSSHNEKGSPNSKDTQSRLSDSTNHSLTEIPKDLDRERGSNRRSDRSLYY